MKLKTHHSAQRGFTLIELVVVIVIISLAAMIVLPLLPSTDAANLRSSARSLAALFRYLGDRSITTKSQHRLVVNLTENRLTVKKMVNGKETTPEDPFLARRFLSDGIEIEDLELPRLGKVGEGTASVDFGGAGLGDLVVIHLKGSRDQHMTLTALPGGGRVEVLDGYQEMKR